MCGCRRLVGCVWISKACRVCGCRRLVGCGWVLKEFQIVILCNHSIFHQLNLQVHLYKKL